MFQKVLFLALAGAIGTVLRFWLHGICEKNITLPLPTATAIVNILGCLMFGLIWAVVAHRIPVDSHVKTVVFIGFFGAFTTFSSFAFETVNLLNQMHLLKALGNVLIHNLCGFIGIAAGLFIGKYAG